MGAHGGNGPRRLGQGVAAGGARGGGGRGRALRALPGTRRGPVRGGPHAQGGAQGDRHGERAARHRPPVRGLPRRGPAPVLAHAANLRPVDSVRVHQVS
ncbi:hypothetical protein STXM2123_2707 [Streptomyces sp. F-3]|nr:hypothetical protein STXM2123_2707 [Streptomyces sp. F-3]